MREGLEGDVRVGDGDMVGRSGFDFVLFEGSSEGDVS